MSVWDDIDAAIAKVEADVEAVAAPLNAEIAALRAELATAGGLPARLAQLGEKIVGKIPAATPTATAESADPPA